MKIIVDMMVSRKYAGICVFVKTIIKFMMMRNADDLDDDCDYEDEDDCRCEARLLRSGCKYEPITGGPQVPVDTMINFPIYGRAHKNLTI